MKKQTISKKDWTILQHIEFISTLGEKCGSIDNLMQKVQVNASLLSEFLKCSEKQAVLFALHFALNISNRCIDIDDLSQYLKCNPLELAAMYTDYEYLISRKLLRRESETSGRRRKEGLLDSNYRVPPSLVESIVKGNSNLFPPAQEKDLTEIMQSLDTVFSDRIESNINYQEMKMEICQLMEESQNLPFIQKITRLDLSDESLPILLFMCQQFFDGEENCNLSYLIRNLYDRLECRFRIRKEFQQEAHELQINDLVEYDDDFFQTETAVKLTATAIELLFPGERIRERSFEGLISCSDIPDIRLYFDERNGESLSFLSELLLQDNYLALQERLAQNQMPKGVTVLLYGAPGTGKTETVYQLARNTGRSVFLVEISEMKSKWFGDSEKLIKQVFDKYRRMVKSSQLTPILLFNEADGIFSKRKEPGLSSVAQTENTMQNILLQEMENLDGILIATTNLATHLDKAFDRRFLYKIFYDLPSTESRYLIWKDKIKALEDPDVWLLAEKYTFSGGQIDNIARKCLMKEVLQGLFPKMDEVLIFCDEENYYSSGTKIGFHN